MIDRFKELLTNYPNDTHLRIAVADISFKFPSDCRYPNLSVKIDSFGLINPLEGRTVSTLCEIYLANYLKAEIIYHDAVVIEDYKIPDKYFVESDEDEKEFVFRTHLKRLFNLRNNAKKEDNELLQQLYKTYSNGLYGKLAQGISDRKMFNTREGGTKRLPKSSITNPFYASMTTGLIRAALSELLVALDELIQEGHNYKIISATTDGILYGIDESILTLDDVIDTTHPKYHYKSSEEALRNGYKRFNPFEKVDSVLAKKIEKFPSLQLLKLSHEAWKDYEYIEIKHTANEILNIKTRGQVGFYKGEYTTCTLLAKAGHKVGGTQEEQASWIIKHYDDKEIETYHFTTLAGIQNIMNEDSPIEDIVSLPQTRIISLDYDFKRYPLNATDTAPHKDINQFMKYRQSADYLKRLKQRASVDAVDYKYKRALQNVRQVGSSKAFCVRHILRGVVHGVEPFGKLSKTYTSLASTLRIFGVTVSQIKHAKSSRFTPNMIEDTSGNRSLIRTILKALGYSKSKTNYGEFLELLLHKKISNKEAICYLD
ncbi:MAG: DNA polymerase [Arcobacteraceae bacterium]|nr:DNA polymerase [Arcobacteraceae bacterium]